MINDDDVVASGDDNNSGNIRNNDDCDKFVVTTTTTTEEQVQDDEYPFLGNVHGDNVAAEDDDEDGANAVLDPHHRPEQEEDDDGKPPAMNTEDILLKSCNTNRNNDKMPFPSSQGTEHNPIVTGEDFDIFQCRGQYKDGEIKSGFDVLVDEDIDDTDVHFHCAASQYDESTMKTSCGAMERKTSLMEEKEHVFAAVAIDGKIEGKRKIGLCPPSTNNTTIAATSIPISTTFSSIPASFHTALNTSNYHNKNTRNNDNNNIPLSSLPIDALQTISTYCTPSDWSTLSSTSTQWRYTLGSEVFGRVRRHAGLCAFEVAMAWVGSTQTPHCSIILSSIVVILTHTLSTYHMLLFLFLLHNQGNGRARRCTRIGISLHFEGRAHLSSTDGTCVSYPGVEDGIRIII